MVGYKGGKITQVSGSDLWLNDGDQQKWQPADLQRIGWASTVCGTKVVKSRGWWIWGLGKFRGRGVYFGAAEARE